MTARIDWPQRHRYMRVHTCLHLLSAVIVAPVTGGQVGDGYGRLDFDLPETPEREDVERQLNALIARDAVVQLRWITDAELDAHPELVKTMSVQPPRGVGRVRLIDVENTDLQPCGGTHVARTGEIGAVRIARIDKKGKQNRRVRVELVQPASNSAVAYAMFLAGRTHALAQKRRQRPARHGDHLKRCVVRNRASES